MKFSPYGNPIPLVTAGFHPEILRGSPSRASNKGGVGKSAVFYLLSLNISKTVANTAKVTIKSHMGFPLAPRSMILDDLELL